MPPSAPPAFVREVERAFGVTVLRTTVADSEIVGALLALNSHGVVVGEELTAREERILGEAGTVESVTSRQNATGNNVLVNDHGAIVHPEFSEAALRSLRRTLRVPVERGTIAGLGTVGMAGLATNQGVVVHPKATDLEVEQLARVLGVPVHRSTANFGVPIVGACAVANSRAILMGRPTTPVEIAHLQEGLKVFE